MSAAPGGAATDCAGLRVGIIGARGIGRHHANWWRLAGAEVVAFAGTSAASVAEAAAALQQLAGCAGRGYTDVGRMLAAERLDWVDVCSPPELHYGHVQAALSAGCRVLCEKPLLHDAHKSSAQLLAAADDLCALAAGGLLALCSQYFVAAQTCLRLLHAARGAGPVSVLDGELASPLKGREPDPVTTWADLGPHLLAAAQALAPEGAMDVASLRAEFRESRVQCEFAVERPAAPPLRCRLAVHHTAGQPAHIRRLTLDGTSFDLQGERDAAGVYGARYVFPGGSHLEEDPMRILIRQVAAGVPPVAGAAVRRNLEWLLRIRDQAARP